MASGHMNRVKRPDTWLHRPMLQNVKKVLANPEPSTHDPQRTSTTKVGNRHTCGSPELWGDSGSYKVSGIARFCFRLNTHMPSVVANRGIAGGSHEYQANLGSTSRLSRSHRSN